MPSSAFRRFTAFYGEGMVSFQVIDGAVEEVRVFKDVRGEGPVLGSHIGYLDGGLSGPVVVKGESLYT